MIRIMGAFFKTFPLLLVLTCGLAAAADLPPPVRQALRAALLQRTGKSALARADLAAVARIGFRNPAYAFTDQAGAAGAAQGHTGEGI